LRPGPIRLALRLTLLTALIAAVSAAGLAAWLLYSEGGFAWALARLQRSVGSGLEMTDARGSLAGGIEIARIRYVHEGTTVEARKVTIRLSPPSLAALSPRVIALRCAELVVAPGPRAGPAALPATLALPLSLEVDEARFDRVVVMGDGAPVELSGVAFAYAGDAQRHRLRDAVVELNGTRIQGQGEIGASRPYPVRAAIEVRRAPAPAAEVKAELTGTLERLQFSARAGSAGARVDAEGTLAPYAPLLIERLAARLEEVDLQAFDAALPRTALSGSIALGAGNALAGEVKITNRLPGRYDGGLLPVASLAAAVRTDLESIRFTNLKADLGAAGSLSGSGTLTRKNASLELTATGLNLAGLHGSLRPTRLRGRLDVTATADGQAVTADLAEREVRIALKAERAGDVVTLHEAHARARGGEARGRGRIELAGAQPFTAEARFAGFNPAAWGDFPAGTINGRATAKGTLGSARVIDGEFTLAPSKLHRAALTGKGRVNVRGERLTAAHADLELGGNRVELRGALGGPGDVLTARIEAPRLDVIHPQWFGRANGTASMSGTLRAFSAKFDVQARGLAFTGWRAATLSAKGEYSGHPDGPLKVAAAATGIVTPQGNVEQATLDVDGTLKGHTASLSARGKTLDLQARARGGWQAGRGWSGTVEDVENAGAYPAKLEGPVALDVGPGRLRAGPIAARIAGGRIDAKESRYEQGRLASEGRFSALPVSSMLALAGLAPAAGGTLRVSGSWALTHAPRWNGTVALLRESGDVSVDARNAVPLGLEMLTVDARVVNDRLELRGNLRARVATGRIEGTVLPVTTPEGERIAAASPIKFAANFEIARLAALSGLTEATLRLDGRVRAAIEGGGTLGDPLVSGTLEGDGISIALPEEGVDLRGGELRAELAEREIRVQSFSIRGGEGVFKARGTLAHGAGRSAALEWQAEKLAVMARPDRRLTVTGRGNATLKEAKVSLSGELRADEGVVELRATTLPSPGADVVIVGRQRQERGTARLAQAALDLALDFGERFRIRGRGLDTLLAGSIRVQTGPAGNLLAKGTVRTVRGTYTAFGQKLTLERGSLIFAGPIENPALDIRAMRKISAVEAGVEVAGTLNAPFVRVVSDPPMPENEALSWLVLGHGPGDAAGTDLSMLPMAAAALLGQGGGESPTTGVARTFGLDSIGMRSGTGTAGTTASQFITFGKRISDDIYIVYEQSLGATANVLKLEFNLSRRVLLRAETGEISAIGLFYRWAFD
jgi:translocation and assembly module TamB